MGDLRKDGLTIKGVHLSYDDILTVKRAYMVQKGKDLVAEYAGDKSIVALLDDYDYFKIADSVERNDIVKEIEKLTTELIVEAAA